MKNQSLLLLIGVTFWLAGSLLSAADQGAHATSKSDSDKPGATSPSTPYVAPALPLSDIKLDFKLDTRLTKSLYMGDRWVSPPTFTQVGIEHANQVIVEAVAYVLDAKGRPLNTTPRWVAAQPDAVAITRTQGNRVKLTVKRAGETTVEVVSQGLSRKLSIKAVARGDTLQVDITPQAVNRPRGSDVQASN
jgi:hypothetical protein